MALNPAIELELSKIQGLHKSGVWKAGFEGPDGWYPETVSPPRAQRNSAVAANSAPTLEGSVLGSGKLGERQASATTAATAARALDRPRASSSSLDRQHSCTCCALQLRSAINSTERAACNCKLMLTGADCDRVFDLYSHRAHELE